MNLIFSLVLIVVILAVLVFIGRKIKIPAVVSLIVGGILINVEPFSSWIISGNSSTLGILGNAGLICLMVIAGLETSWRELYKEKKDSFAVASSTILFSFILGFGVFVLMGHSMATALVVGIVMSITAEATRAKVLIDLRALKSRIGAALMGAGIFDDFFGILMFLLIAFLFGGDLFGEDLIIVGAVAAFFVGIILHKTLGRESETVSTLESLATWLVVPFFFVSMGGSFGFKSLIVNPWLLIVTLVVGFSVKFLGAYASKIFTNFDWKQLTLIGWAMNSRGAIGIALALVALRQGLISQAIYSSLIILALASTTTFPFVISRMVKKNRKIMN